MASELRIVFDGPPGPEAGRFVEVENEMGKSIRAGEWHERGDGLWELRIATAPTDAALRAVVEAARALDAELTAWFDFAKDRLPLDPPNWRLRGRLAAFRDAIAMLEDQR